LFKVGSKSCIFMMFSLTSDLLACLLSICHLLSCMDGLDSFLHIMLSPRCGFGEREGFQEREGGGTRSFLFFRRFVFLCTLLTCFTHLTQHVSALSPSSGDHIILNGKVFSGMGGMEPTSHSTPH
jgi:hypothetical protein